MEDFERYLVKAQDSKNPNEGYHTDDLDDAIGTAKAQAVRMGVAFKVVDNRRKRLAGVAQPDGIFGHSASSVVATAKPGIVSIDKSQLREMVRAAVVKRLEEGKVQASEPVRDIQKEIADKRRQIQESKSKMRQMKESALSGESVLGKKNVGMEAMGGGAPGPMAPMEENPKKASNPYSAEELGLFIQRSEAIQNGNVMKAAKRILARQMQNGQYDSAKAPEIWMHVVNAAAKIYIDDYANGTEMVDKVFGKDAKLQVATELAREFEQSVKSGEPSLDSHTNNFFGAPA